MNIEWDWRKIAIISAASVLFIGTNVGQYYWIWGPKQEQIKADLNGRIELLQATLDNIGPMVDIWAVREEAAETFPGQQIQMADLEARQIPESLLSPSYILEPETIVGKYYKVALTPGTPLSMGLVMEEPIDDTTREYDLFANLSPIGLKVGDYVDYRIVYPMGEDYIVLTHKRIEAINGKSVKFKMSEAEIHFYQAALLDYFLQSEKGAMLYMTKYVEPGIQKAATEYYAVPKNIEAIMIADPNLVQKLDTRLNDTARTMIDAGTANILDEAGQAIRSGRDEVKGELEGGAGEFANAQQARADAEAQRRAEAGYGQAEVQPETQPAAPSTSAASSSSSSASSSGTSSGQATSGGTNSGTDSQTLTIEKGVVE
ncbi:SAF domain-containing protein [Cohnella fermenti]|uniref:SAF domain-containing protein n=1 Tax=Cohnella fermenti TaxID=2565925 RepID=A0A4S4BJK6_9BACL|nr:SAF domain-containing protein [Cohnella fermenti]THF74754.1 hypothetical protein E6C55_24410 [Cohnella fermenti]